MPGAIDLHAHTTASDGTLSPPALVRAAARRGLAVLAVTDHDSTEGLAEAFDEARRHPALEIIPGIEINCDVDGAEIHILGYEMDHEAGWFQEFCREQRRERRERIHRIAAQLADLGVTIDPEEVFTLAGDGAAGRPHVARVLVRRGHVRTTREAFDRYLAAGQPGYVPRRRVGPEDAVRLIRRAGGVPALAHPGLAGRDDLIPSLVAAGLLGIECHYAEHSLEQTAAYLELCRRHDLVATGGSDFHGPSVSAARLGVPRVPLGTREALRTKAALARSTRATASAVPDPSSRGRDLETR